ncbi:hypothetical protein HUT19_15645 [Streptomyces sp. NA02950]|uniref:hypothetical protein n=1 Tax=Streptomyces sp. NA02950 TaxID=2742137 RepID=UPI001590E024|nr:hypothetical protein [Streptomyces sp. NA02950]QKV93012.1 hypothetical protein HUT19_15645 [Streptomyces sp. NA02950]
MKSHRALAVLAELRSLAAHDARQLSAAKDRLARAEAELAAARSGFDSASARAGVSQRVVHGAEELLHTAAHDRGEEPRGARTVADPAGRTPTIAQEVLAFLRPRRRAARAEIVRHMKSARPDIKPASLRRELNRMVTKRTLVLVEGSLYVPVPAAGGDQ